MREKQFSRVQYKMLSEMAAAEVVKLDIPKEIDSLNKQLHKADDARNQLIMDKAIEKAHTKWRRKGNATSAPCRQHWERLRERGGVAPRMRRCCSGSGFGAAANRKEKVARPSCVLGSTRRL